MTSRFEPELKDRMEKPERPEPRRGALLTAEYCPNTITTKSHPNVYWASLSRPRRMKLLRDDNLSPKLTDRLATQHRGTAHVREVGLKGAIYHLIWQCARNNGFAMVSKHDDFRQRGLVEGAPPKVIWLQVGNARTSEIAALLLSESADLTAFEQEEGTAIRVIANHSRQT